MNRCVMFKTRMPMKTQICQSGRSLRVFKSQTVFDMQITGFLNIDSEDPSAKVDIDEC